jgi:hypothetical protein
MDTKRRDQMEFRGIHESITEVSQFQVSKLCEVCKGRLQRPWDSREYTSRLHGSGFQGAEIRCRHHTVQTMDTRMEDEPPSRLHSWVKLHVSGPTHVTHEGACTPSSMCSLFPGT